MPKYERFDNVLAATAPSTPSASPATTPPTSPTAPLKSTAASTTASTTTIAMGTPVDDDESFTMFIGNNHSISPSSNGSENHGSNYNGRNSNNSSSSSSSINYYGNSRYSSNNNSHCTSHSNSNGNHKSSNGHNLMNGNRNHSNYHNNNSNNSSLQQMLLDHDESTMEVPLLTNNNNGGGGGNNHNDPDYEERSRACRCEQPGFAADLSSRTTQEAKLKILLAISLCCVFMIIEFLGGYLAGSLAIMTDAAHLASDCISFVIGLVAIWLGARPPDRQMSFGYKRTEVMGAIVSILSIWILTATLVMVAVERLYSNDFDLDANTMMTISGIGILINIVMAFILHGSSLLPGGSHGHSHSHSHSHGHSHTHAPGAHNALMDDDGDATGNGLKHIKGSSSSSEKNLNLRAAMIHVIGDLVQSVGVFVAAIVIKLVPSAKFADPLCTLLFSVIVIMTTVGLFKESVGILMDAVPLQVSLASLERDLAHIEGVKSVHHLNVWSHTANHNVMMVHLVIDLLSDSNTVLERARDLARGHKYNIKHSTVQIERLPA